MDEVRGLIVSHTMYDLLFGQELLGEHLNTFQLKATSISYA